MQHEQNPAPHFRQQHPGGLPYDVSADWAPNRGRSIGAVTLPTRTASTEAAYIRTALILARRAARDGVAWSNASAFSAWLVAHCTGVDGGVACARSTWRQYRAAVSHLLRRQQPPGWQAALTALTTTQPAGLARRAARQPGRTRAVRPSALRRLMHEVAECDYRRSPLAAVTHLWWHAGRLTGLRPCEWLGIRLQRETDVSGRARLWLVVTCAKTTNGRGCAPQRRMDLMALAAAERHAVLAWVQLVAPLRPAQFADLQRRVARLLRRANARLARRGAKRVTLYTARHRFAAAAKRSASEAEVAALLGHASIATASECYGRRARGHAGSIPAPDPLLVQVVIAANRDRPAPRRPIFASREAYPRGG